MSFSNLCEYGRQILRAIRRVCSCFTSGSAVEVESPIPGETFEQQAGFAGSTRIDENSVHNDKTVGLWVVTKKPRDKPNFTYSTCCCDLKIVRRGALASLRSDPFDQCCGGGDLGTQRCQRISTRQYLISVGLIVTRNFWTSASSVTACSRWVAVVESIASVKIVMDGGVRTPKRLPRRERDEHRG